MIVPFRANVIAAILLLSNVTVLGAMAQDKDAKPADKPAEATARPPQGRIFPSPTTPSNQRPDDSV